MNENIKKISWLLLLLAAVFSCREDLPQLGVAPTEADAAFTFKASTNSKNILVFSNASSAFVKKWDLGNGKTEEGNEVTGTYPVKGTYTVKLTVFTSGGSVTSTQQVVIENTDINLLDIPVYNLLTGGATKPAGKTWVIDATRDGHFGVGPNPSDATLGDVPNYYSANANDKVGTGLYDDEFTFSLTNFSFTQKTNGDVYLNNKYAADFPGAFDNLGDKTAPFTAPTNLTWTIPDPSSETKLLTISLGGFVGYYSGSRTYKIVSLSENELILRSVDAKDPLLAWYQRFIPKGYVPPLPTPAFSTLPINFETSKAPFVGFEGASYDVINNPFATGLNTSAKVGKYEKGTQQSFAGLQTNFETKFDFSTKTTFQLKVYSPVVGRALLKLETADNSATAIEVFAEMTEINKWQTLSFNFPNAKSNTYNRISLFFDFDKNNGGTFYFDDIDLKSVPSAFSLDALTAGSSKTWKLKTGVGSFGVGPAKGTDTYYPNGKDISGERPCLWNDEYIFKTGGVYQYDSKGDVFGEAYLGITPDGCQPESALGANAKAWGSATNSFTYDAATATTPAYITVKGTGAFIVLPKAKNGSEYAAGPPTTNGSVKYEVLNYSKSGTTETLTLTLETAKDVFWTFVLTNK